MIPLIEQHRAELAQLCGQYGVRRLYVFGSATTGTFTQGTSDLDFLVSLTDRRPTGSYADRILDLAQALERLFRHPVDLITEESVRNPFFRREVEATRQLVYGQ